MVQVSSMTNVITWLIEILLLLSGIDRATNRLLQWATWLCTVKTASINSTQQQQNTFIQGRFVSCDVSSSERLLGTL